MKKKGERKCTGYTRAYPRRDKTNQNKIMLRGYINKISLSTYIWSQTRLNNRKEVYSNSKDNSLG